MLSACGQRLHLSRLLQVQTLHLRILPLPRACSWEAALWSGPHSSLDGESSAVPLGEDVFAEPHPAAPQPALLLPLPASDTVCPVQSITSLL